MFFIVPDKKDEDIKGGEGSLEVLEETPNKRKRANVVEEVPSYYSRRVPKACDRCRVKKIRCTGGSLCQRCKQDGVVCVTSQESKKGNIQHNPAYVQLVESQRDQLAQALQQILQSKDTIASAKLRDTLVEMGIDTSSLPKPQQPSDTQPARTTGREAVSNELPWNDFFQNLDADQIQGIGSFCAQTPEMFDTLQPGQLDWNPHQFSPQAFDDTLPFSANKEYLCQPDLILGNDVSSWEVAENNATQPEVVLVGSSTVAPNLLSKTNGSTFM